MVVEHFVCEMPASISSTTKKKERKLAVGCGPVVEALLSVAGPGVDSRASPTP